MDDQNQPLDTGLDPASENPTGLTITHTIRQYWHECSRWGLFFAILGFVYIGFLVLATIGIGVTARFMLSSIFSLLVGGGLVFVFSWLMIHFAQNLRKALDMDSTPAANLSFRNLKFLYQIAGILIIVMLAIYGLIFLSLLVLYTAN